MKASVTMHFFLHLFQDLFEPVSGRMKGIVRPETDGVRGQVTKGFVRDSGTFDSASRDKTCIRYSFFHRRLPTESYLHLNKEASSYRARSACKGSGSILVAVAVSGNATAKPSRMTLNQYTFYSYIHVTQVIARCVHDVSDGDFGEQTVSRDG